MATTAPLKCPLKGHLTGLAHYQSIENAFKAGFMAAVESAAAGVALGQSPDCHRTTDAASVGTAASAER